MDKEDARPVWFTIWGGSLDLAQALWKVKQERSEKEFVNFCSKIKVYSIADQYDTCGEWIRENAPGILYLTAYHSFRGMYRGGDESLVSAEWVSKNILCNHGALGEAYPNYDGGDPWGEVKGIKEGDTPSFLYLIPNGLGVPEQPECSSWGGSFILRDGKYVDKKYGDKVHPQQDGACTSEYSERASVFRFRRAFQNDFQARLDWCVKEYSEANHPPAAVISVKQNKSAAQYYSPGENVLLDGSQSTDPDGDALHCKWWIDESATGKNVKAELYPLQGAQAELHILEDSGCGELHVVLEVTDCGMPPLTRYARVILIIR